MRRSQFAVVVLLALLAGCGKKGPAQAAASEESKKFLPPDPVAYVELDVKALLGSTLFKGHVDQLRAGLPAECQATLDAAEKISVGVYGSVEDLTKMFVGHKKHETAGEESATPPAPEPVPDIAVLLTGATKDQLLGCVAAAAHGAVTPREEQRGGQTVTLVPTPMGDVAIFTPDATTILVATAPRLEAVLAALGGGPTIQGSPLLAAIGAVPAGAIVGAANIPSSMAEMMTEGLAAFSGGKPIPPPTMFAASLSLGDALGVVASLTMADEASAQSLEGIANTAVSGAKTLLAAMGGDSPMAKSLKPVLDSISVSRSGASVAVHVRVSREVLDEMMTSRHGRDDAPPPPAPAP